MSGPPPVSGSPYIILCSGQIGVRESSTAMGKVRAASDCAMQFCSWLESNREVDLNDFRAVSDLQHEMMDGMKTYSKKTAEAKAKEMFDLLGELEDKYPPV